MFSRIGLLILIATAVMASTCEKRGNKIIVSDACEQAWKIFYARDGRFIFTDEEIDHLRPINVDKLTDFKRWFKQECPEQYARTGKRS